MVRWKDGMANSFLLYIQTMMMVQWYNHPKHASRPQPLIQHVLQRKIPQILLQRDQQNNLRLVQHANPHLNPQTKQPTPRPTRKPTSKPTSKPTMPLTEPWDKVASPLSTKQNKRHNVESSNDDKLLKDAQRKARALTANAPQAKARGANTINLYDYAFKYHGVTRPEMEAALAQYQDTLIDDPENKAVIIKQYTCSNKHDLSHVSSFMTCIDVTLEELHQFA
eukprot:698430_1